MAKKRKHSGFAYARRISRDIVHHPANEGHRLRSLARGWGWQARKRILRRPVDVPYEGYVLRCHPDSQSASNVWYFTARYDHDEMDFLDRYLRPGDEVLDIGANIGTYVLFMARRTGPGGRITAMEPEPRNAVRLRETVDLNGLADRVAVHEAAATEEAGEVEFTLDHDVSNSIAQSAGARGARAVVRAVTLDSVVTPVPHLSVAKMDVEGAELLALRGAPALLSAQRPPVWITEVFDNQLRKLGATGADVRAEFERYGFEPFSWSAGRGRLAPIVGDLRGNVVFVAAEQLADVRARLGDPS